MFLRKNQIFSPKGCATGHSQIRIKTPILTCSRNDFSRTPQTYDLPLSTVTPSYPVNNWCKYLLDGKRFTISVRGESVSFIDLFPGTTLKGRQQETVKPKILKFCMETLCDSYINFNGSSVPIGTLLWNTFGWSIYVSDKFL